MIFYFGGFYVVVFSGSKNFFDLSFYGGFGGLICCVMNFGLVKVFFGVGGIGYIFFGKFVLSE